MAGFEGLRQTSHSAGSLGTLCKPKFGNFDGNGPRPGERCETKWRIFGKIHPNVRQEGPGAEQNFRFGSGWPVRAAHVAMYFWQFGIAGRRINSCSFCLFFSYVVIFEIVELYSVDFVLPSMLSSSKPQATKPSFSPSHGVVRMSEKVYLVRRKQRVKGRGKKEKKDDVTSHQRKGSLPSSLTPSHSPFAFYSPSCKTVLLLPRRLSVPPALPCKASQGKERRSSSPRSLCHFVTRGQQGFRQHLLERPWSLRHRNWPNRK